LGAIKPKGLTRIGTIGYGHIGLSEIIYITINKFGNPFGTFELAPVL